MLQARKEAVMDVVFAVMPFADVNRPAIGVSLLKAGIERAGFSSRIEYFNIAMAELMGYEVYEYIVNALSSDSMAGEWFFADVVFDKSIPHEREYITKHLSRYAQQEEWRDKIVQARQHRQRFVEQCAARIKELGPRVVGFTTTFHQTCACLAVARRLKEMPDPPVIIFGGANCEGEMGLQMIQSFPWIDYVSTGEADQTFPLFLERLLREGNTAPLPGILKRAESTTLTAPEPVRAMDSLPIPDYSEYYRRVEASSLKENITPALLIETARGCWWGAKQHCTFCGLNGDTMAFRSKSPQRVFDELAFLSQTYGLKKIDCVDNILDTKYINTLFPQLRDSNLGLEIFYEVKANLRYEQLAILRAGGLYGIQPGIESFSNEVLRLMRKGCTGLQNIQLLRWCMELGIEVAYNIIAGFPGESVSEYERMSELIPLLTHLQAPAATSPVRLDRFSPFFTQSGALGLSRLRPTVSYYYCYPLGRRDLARLAYYFDFDYQDGRKPREYMDNLRQEVNRWLQVRFTAPENQPRLDAEYLGLSLNITDTRPAALQTRYQFAGLAAELYWRCDSAQSLTGLQREFGAVADSAEIAKLLEEFIAARLMIEMEGQYLSLAVMRNRPAQDKPGPEHVYSKIQQTPAADTLLRLV
jgi:ribosomal peptide maturation radical SAM protein 1